MSSTAITDSPTDPGQVSSRPHRLRWVVVVVVMTANIMDAMDATIANIAGPSVRQDLGGGASTLQWISAGYTLAFAVLLIAGARLGDIFGRRRVFLVGLAGFTLFSAVCAAAPSMPVLIASRALQGAFGALMIPQGFGFLKQVFPDQAEFNQAMGYLGPATGLPLLAAPVLAGALIDANLWHVGWRLVFLINVPIGVVALALAIPALPDTARRPGLKLDVGGVWLIGLALVAIIYPLIQGRADGWPLWILALLAVGLLLLFAFLRYERGHQDHALIEPTLLKNRTYLSGLAVLLFFFGGFSGLLLCVSLYGQLGEGWSPIHAGLALTPMVIGMIIGLTASFALVKRLGRHLLHIGILLIAAGDTTVALTLTTAHTASAWDLVPGLLLAGLGAGASFAQLFGFVLNTVNMDEVGSASGVLEATQQLSTSLGVAVLGTIFFSVFDHHLPTDALQITAWACLAPLVGAFLLVFGLPMRALDEQAQLSGDTPSSELAVS
jgi:EmrB/QacA subfamily drug resistance transporter